MGEGFTAIWTDDTKELEMEGVPYPKIIWGFQAIYLDLEVDEVLVIISGEGTGTKNEKQSDYS